MDITQMPLEQRLLESVTRVGRQMPTYGGLDSCSCPCTITCGETSIPRSLATGTAITVPLVAAAYPMPESYRLPM